MAGLTPPNAADLNSSVGTHLRQFVEVKETILHDYSNLLGLDLQAPPYSMTAADETDIKSAISQLNTDLQAVDMTFINRLTGLF